MTSKTSCNNSTSYKNRIPYRRYILENIKQRSWLAATSLIAFFLLQPVYIMVNIENFLTTSGAEYITSYQDAFPYMLSGANNLFFTLALIILAIACAVSGYAFLHQPKSVDFYHGFPVKRTQWFTISYIGGFLIFLIPYTFSSLCSLIIAGIKGVLVSSNFLPSILAIIGGILGFLILYHTAILAMMLTGQLVAGALASGVLIVYGSMIQQLCSGLISTFLHTHYVPVYPEYYAATSAIIPEESLWGVPSPLGIYTLLTHPTVAGIHPLFPILFSIMVAAALWFAARTLYQKRALECAGNALAYPRTASFIKVLIVIPTALFIGLFLGSFYYGSGTKWMIFISILAAILLCGVIEYIYSRDLSQICKRKWSSLLSIFTVIGILAVMRLDLFGYDTWLPEKEKLESMSFYSDTYSEYFQYPSVGPNVDSSSYPNTQYYTLYADNAQQKEFSAIYTLAEEGILNHNLGITSDRLYQEDMEDYTSIVIRFNQKNGSTAYRSYLVKRSSFLDCLENLCRSESYRNVLFPAFHIKSGDIESITVNDLLTSTPLKLTEEQKEVLLRAYQQDLLQVKIADLHSARQIGTFLFQMKADNNTRSETEYYDNQISNLYIYSTYENTLRQLREYGYPICAEIRSEDVVQMTRLTDSVMTKDTYNPDGMNVSDTDEIRTPVTDPTEMQTLLNRVTYSTYGITGYKYSTNAIEVLLKGEVAARRLQLLPE